jgi:phosphopantothenoylcysteine decarboxylase
VAEPTARGVLYHVVCAAPRARYAGELVHRAQGEGWTVCVIATPSALAFIDVLALEQQTGFSVRSDYAPPGSEDLVPAAAAMVVCPATVAAPAVNDAQAAHPAFARSIAELREMGVTVLYGPGVYEPAPPGTGGRPYDWQLPLRALNDAAGRSAP